ncbi:lebercilin-like protein isoform X2 [Hyperolius riggenbachi]|uniref:lebercilin-like protein isoform X2 n=1 Tax=Hyperolius riggenbachi TaxID=752182 RepID=UPI0035A322C5
MDAGYSGEGGNHNPTDCTREGLPSPPSSPNIISQNPSSDGSKQSPSGTDYTPDYTPFSSSCNEYSSLDDSDNAEEEKSHSGRKDSIISQSPAKTTKTKIQHHVPLTGKKGFSWRNPVPLRHPLCKRQPAHPTDVRTSNKGTQRILSARLHKIKEFTNKLCDVQRELESESSENRLLMRLQHRHTKELEKFESPENSLSKLLNRQSNEVRFLRDKLRASQEQKQHLSSKLTGVESDLLRMKNELLRLQKLSEDKNLGNKEHLHNKLCNLLQRMEICDTNIEMLEKRHHSIVRFYNRQLVAEFKMVSEAQDTKKRLQAKIAFVQQKLKEKERQLAILNIYASRAHHRGFTLTKSTQTEKEMIIQEREDVEKPHNLCDKTLQCMRCNRQKKRAHRNQTANMKF